MGGDVEPALRQVRTTFPLDPAASTALSPTQGVGDTRDLIQYSEVGTAPGSVGIVRISASTSENHTP